MGKKIGLILVVIFGIALLWAFVIITWGFLTNHKMFKFDYVTGIVSSIAWVITVVWGAIAGVNVVERSKFSANNKEPVSMPIDPSRPK